MSDPTSRPAIAKKRDNMDEYDTIFVEFPIWWYIAPTIVNAFLESYDLTGKTIIPFATSGGSGMGKTNEALKPRLHRCHITRRQGVEVNRKEGGTVSLGRQPRV